MDNWREERRMRDNIKVTIKTLDDAGIPLTDEQVNVLMDQVKEYLSLDEIEDLFNTCCGSMYTALSMYEGEMGGFDRY